MKAPEVMMKDPLRGVLAFAVRHDLAITIILFAVWLTAVVFGETRRAGGVTLLPRQAVWAAGGFVLLMLLERWEPYRALRAQFREEHRARHGLLAEMSPERVEEVRRLMASLERKPRAVNSDGDAV